MKKTHFIELLNNIKSTIISFVSIVLFVCLSIAIFTGISWMTTNFSTTIDEIMQETNYHDNEIMFTYGFDDDDLNEIKKIDDNIEIEALNSTYEFFELNDSKLQALVYEIPKSIDTLIAVDGNLPINDNEIGIDSYFAEIYNYNIGDVITFDENISQLSKINNLLNYDIEDNNLDSITLDDNQQFLKNRDFVITCIFKTPRLIALSKGNYAYSPLNSKIIDAYMIVNKNAFNDDAYVGYTNLLIRNHDFDIYSIYDDEYTDLMDSFSDTLNDEITTLVNKKNLKIKNKIIEIKNDANCKIEDSKKEIEDSKKEIKDAKIKIKNNKQDLADAKIELDDGLIKLQDAEKEYSQGENDLNKSKNDLSLLVADYNSINEFEGSFLGTQDELVLALNGMGVFDKVKTLTGEDIFNGLSTSDEQLSVMHSFMKNYINNASNLIHNGENALADAREEIDNGYDTYYDNLDKYNTAVNDLKKAETDLRNAEIDLKNAEEDLNEATNLYNDFVEKTDEFEDGKYSISYRRQNTGVILCDTLIIMFDKLRYSMAALFVIVGLLVCYSVISRIVNNQIQCIGTKKALGLNSKQITIYYLSYTGIAVFIGSILGLILGYFGVESIFINIINNSFSKELVSYFEYGQAVSICLLEIVLLLLVTYIACNSILKKNAIVLLKGENESCAKVRFYEKTKFWNKLSLLSKTIVNNFFNDKRRVFATLIGIAGATSLIVTAITFRDNFADSFKYQFDEVFYHKLQISYDVDSGHEEDIINYLNSNNIDNSFVFMKRGFIKCEDGSNIYTYNLVSLDLDSFKRMVNIIPFIDNDSDPYKGCWVNGSYANYYGSKNGDILEVYDNDGNKYNITVTGFYKYYLMNSYIIYDKETYDSIYNDDVKANTILVNTDNINIKTLMKDIYNIDDTVSFNYIYESDSYNMFDQLSKAILIVYVTLSIIMALLVPLNLFVMFINERKYELIIMMINGFSRKDAKRYIYSDIVILTILGTIIGAIVGSYVGNASVSSFETNLTMMLKKVDSLAIIIGILGSYVLIFVISLISLKKIDKFRLSDINKP